MAQPSTSYVPITDNAAASRKIRHVQRTDGSDTVEEAAVALSEPFLPTYLIQMNTAISAATANSHLIQIMAGSSLRVGIKRIRVTQSANGTTQQNIWEIRRVTTAGTGGTSITPAALDPADTGAGATAMTLPTAKGTESTLLITQNVLTHATAATVGLNPVLDIDFTGPNQKIPWIAAGTSNGIVLKNQTASASTTLLIAVWIVEASWT